MGIIVIFKILAQASLGAALLVFYREHIEYHVMCVYYRCQLAIVHAKNRRIIRKVEAELAYRNELFAKLRFLRTYALGLLMETKDDLVYLEERVLAKAPDEELLEIAKEYKRKNDELADVNQEISDIESYLGLNDEEEEEDDE